MRAVLAPLPGLTALTQLPAREEGTCSFRLEGAEGADLREAVFWACARAELPLLELRRDQMTLEDIFLKLTSDEGGTLPPEGRTDLESGSPTQTDRTEEAERT